MINKVRVKALKSIKDLTVSCADLNLIVGTNSAGKSTFLQALLLDAQNHVNGEGRLNGELVSMGEYREVRNYSMPNSNIEIEIWQNGDPRPTKMEFWEDSEGKCKVNVSAGEQSVRDIILDGELYEEENHLFYNVDLKYLSCHRVGPRDIYAKNFNKEDVMGIDGEYAFSYLLNHMEDSLDEYLVKEGTVNTLYSQVNYWLDYIIGTRLAIGDIKKTNYLQVKYNNNPANVNSESLYSRPINVGSGVSYLITILIECLSSAKKDIILIENPEIHLHPKAQSRLCEFLYFISCANRQLFIETHSDHIFNGVRVGISTGSMDRDKIAIDFFVLDEMYNTQCNKIEIGDFGKIIGTNKKLNVNDLFDQFDLDLDKMLGL